jgi:hypothetical protein
MTTPIPLAASVDPGSIQVSSPGEYQITELTLTIANPTSSPYDLSNGLNIVLPLDPGGGGVGSLEALVLSTATETGGGQTEPTALIDVSPSAAAGTNWQITEDSPDSCQYSALPNDSGILGAGASLQFTFSNVVADFVPGSANITISVPPATATGTALSFTVSITKLSAFSIMLEASPPHVTMPFTTTNLTWQVTGAPSCAFTWTPADTVVSYNNGAYSDGELPDPPFQFGQGDPVPVATIYQATSFTLIAPGPNGAPVPTTLPISLDTPRFAALTMPPVVNGPPPAGGGPAGTPVVTGVEQDGPGDPAGGQPVTITGTGFTGATAVTFGHAEPLAASEFEVDATGSTITVTAAPPVDPIDVDNSAPGTVVDITVTVGAGTSPVTSAVNPGDQYTYANYATSTNVAPYQPFELIWSCYNNTFPTLSWTGPPGTEVTVDTAGVVISLQPPVKLATSGTVTAAITAPTTFSLGVTAGPAPQSQDVHLFAPVLPAFTATSVNPVAGVQSATLNWTAQNATSFTLTIGENSLSLPYYQSSYAVTNLTAPTTYVLAANGFDPADNPVSVTSRAITLTPIAVTLQEFYASATTIKPGESVTLTWAATAASGYTLSPVGYFRAAATSTPVTPMYSTIYTLTAEGYSPNGPQFMTIEVEVTTKQYDKIPTREKNILPETSQPVTAPGAIAGPGDLADPDPAAPGGTEQSFIGPDERPDADAPGAPGPTAGEA